MGAQITVGLDFGTHQTKLCIEQKNGVELGYSFFKFKDTYDKSQYTFPSIIQINSDGKLNYGYVQKTEKSKIIRYFKQAAFTSAPTDMKKDEAVLYSVWFLAYILFDLEELYGTEFSIQMGVPSDSTHLDSQRQLAVSILLSAYRLVEEVFENDKDAFLQSTFKELKEKTEIIKYSKELKEEFQILVFPEAYACLMPLVASSKIDGGMSLMVDIGGGTTDISFFTIEEDKKNPMNSKLKVYDFQSINKGLNFLTNSDFLNDKKRLDSNIGSASELSRVLIKIYKNELNRKCGALRRRLFKEFKIQGDLPESHFYQAIAKRPIVYTGGGSSFATLRQGYHGFKDVIHINHKQWKSSIIEDLSTIVSLGLCPILSTAYGLSISRTHDKIICEPFRDVFRGIRQTKNRGHEYSGNKGNKTKTIPKSFGRNIGGSQRFSYMDDYDAWK